MGPRASGTTQQQTVPPSCLTRYEVNKYVIGYFATFEAAKGFEADMKKLGIKDSWLVPYKDGVRITDEEAESLLGHPIRDDKKKKK